MTLPLTLVDLLENAVKMAPHQVAYFFLEEKEEQWLEITYEELARKSKILATLLQQRTKAKDRILLLYPPGIELLIAFFACLYAGTIAVLAYPPATEELALKLQMIIENSQPTLCLSTQNLYQKIRKLKLAKLIKNVPILHGIISKLIPTTIRKATECGKWDYDKLTWLTTDNFSAKQMQTVEKVHSHINSETIAFLQYTSGTTKHPRGIMITHENVLNNVKTIYEQTHMTPNDSGVIWLPPYHDMGLIGGILTPLYGQFPVYLINPMSFIKCPLLWLKTLSKYRASITSAPNFAYEICIKKIPDDALQQLDLSNWRIALNGAEPIQLKTIERFSQKFSRCGFNIKSFLPCYGLGEATLLVSTTSPKNGFNFRTFDMPALQKNIAREHSSSDDHERVSLVSSGYICPANKVIIVDPYTFNRCEENAIGEIWISGKNIAKGYWGLSEESKNIFEAYTHSGEGPFFKTGDMGFIRENELFITGRLHDMMVIDQRHHYPHDIELTLQEGISTSSPGTFAAFSIKEIHDNLLVVILEQKIALDEVSYADLFKKSQELISKRHGLLLYDLILVPPHSLKKTTSGKLKRSILKDSYQKGNLFILNSLKIPLSR